MPKITKRTIDALPERTGRELIIWDNELRGFGLRIKPGGARSFLVQYRNVNGRSRRLTVGRYGVLTAEEARGYARKLLADVARGQDPAQSRRADRNAITIAALCREYLDKAERGLILSRRRLPKKASTLMTDRGRIERHIIPLLGGRPVKEISAVDIRGFLRDVTAGKTAADVRTKPRGRAIVKGGRGTASRTLGLLGGILAYGIDEGIRTDNPVAGVQRAKDGKRTLRLDRAGYRRLGKRLAAAERAGFRWQVLDAIRLLALTGCRRGEVEGLTKAEVDIAGHALRLGDTKTGASVRPLGNAAINVLERVLERSKTGYMFPAVRGPKSHFKGLAKAWRAIAGTRLAGATPHTLRHSFASTAEDLGFTVPTIGALLGHAGQGVTSGYIHKLDSALVAAADATSTAVASFMDGDSTERHIVHLQSPNANDAVTKIEASTQSD